MNGQPLRYLSLFSGIGGFDLGFDRAGMVCAGQVEFDEKARAVLAKHWPDVPRLNDVREVQGHEFGTVDVIAGGFPCQDVSVAGRRAGLAGERSGLWFEFHRLIDRVRPRWAVIENVPNLLRTNGGGDFATILSGLAGSGYLPAWRVLNALSWGIPQQRRRLFIVGCYRAGSAAQVLFNGETGGLVPERESAPIAERAFNRRGGYGWTETQGYILTLNGGASESHQGGIETPLVIGDGNMPRWMTPVEVERCAGFPDNWTDGASNRTRIKQMMNAVVPQIAEWIARRILELDAAQAPEFVNAHNTEVGQAVTVRAKNHAILQGVFTAV